ncbi:ankyrin repeat domain-containing protein 50-like [Haliotis cracherodii]|uniref:ankyrin repeat domain-containing protein 50-like n=1 Tax=Haliotis cracherodii TaxID=6455 RepID=UPI0039EA5C7D
MLGSLLVTVFAAVHGALVCDFGKYGKNCDRPCSEECGLFPERNLRPCHKDTGACLQGCVRGRHGDQCDQLCSHNCINTTCNQGNGGCTIGCIEGYIGYFCNTTDPTVQNGIICNFGKYGQNCDRPCSEDCGLFPKRNLRPCHKYTGKCLHGCVRGRHGDKCDQLCSHNCINTTCNQGNGGCTIGCIDGHVGYFCNITTGSIEENVKKDIICDTGQYGRDCDLSCSEDCGLFPETNLRPCHRDNGTCLQGCVHGRHGDHCDQLCSPNCIKTTCNQRNAGCTIGCIDGHSGYFCNTTTGEGHIRHSMHWMWMLPVAVLIFLTICCWKRYPRSSSSDPSQDVSQSERVPLVPLTTQESDRHASSDPSLYPRLSTASHATPSQADRDLYYASEAGDQEEVKRLLSTPGVNVNCRVGGWRRTSVMKAAEEGRRDVVELLVSKGADVSLVDEYGNNTLHHACIGGDIETVKFVLSLNVVDINSRGWGSRTPVMRAALYRHRKVEELLVSKGADVSLVDVVGNNTLHWACRGGDFETVEFVLSLNVVDINSRGVGGRTPVMRAAEEGHRDVVELLVSKGADVSLVDEDGDSILHLACWGGDVETVEFVLSLNLVDINSRGGGSRTPVVRAAERGHRDLVELLVSKGADVSLVDVVGDNILHWACWGGEMETVEFVLSQSVVDVDARNNSGRTAVDWARLGGHQRVADLLVSRGAR